MAFAAPFSIEVTVSDASGKVAYKGKTGGDGTFATGKLQPGNYIVQFNSSNLKGNRAIVVSAGSKKVSADSVPASKFGGGGVAMRIEVGKGLNINGEVAAVANGMVTGNNSKAHDASVDAMRGIQDKAGVGSIRPLSPGGTGR